MTDREAQLLLDATRAGITSPKEMANFMAQVSAESQGLTRLEESFRYTRGISQIPVRYAHRDGDQVLETARVDALNGKPEALAKLMYGGRMGNDQHGDAYAYRGRGYMQLTGKENYEAAGKALGLELVNDPDLASRPENASKIATWYWENRVPEKARENVKAATLAINGGYNGLDAREAQFAKWEKALTPELMDRLSKGEVGTSVESPETYSRGHATHLLQSGMNGLAVSQLQLDLSKLGYTGADGKPLPSTGHFGSDTRHAVEAFQRDHHLDPVDGKVGHDTQTVMAAAMQAKLLPRLDDKHHPDFALYEQALAGVHKAEAERGMASGPYSQNVAAALVVAAKSEGLSHIDSVALSDHGERAFAEQKSSLPGIHGKLAFVETQHAIHTTLAQSSAALMQLNQTLQDPALNKVHAPAPAAHVQTK